VPLVQSECEHEPWGGAVLVAVHLLEMQVWLLVHVLPQLPQLELSLVVSTQEAEQSVPLLQTQTLAVHDAPDGHALPQLPQLRSSPVVSMHWLPHVV
jgi:hypothetical protein